MVKFRQAISPIGMLGKQRWSNIRIIGKFNHQGKALEAITQSLVIMDFERAIGSYPIGSEEGRCIKQLIF